MSHFAVLVPANDYQALKKVLQPFHEFECTGENDQYVQEVDVTEKVLEEGLDYYGLEDRTVLSEDEIDRNGDHKYGYALVDNAGKVLKAIDRTNPNKKWDWWEVGGRWSGSLLLRSLAVMVGAGNGMSGGLFAPPNSDPRRADYAPAGSVDWQAEARTKADGALDRYDAYHAILDQANIQITDALRFTHAEALDKWRVNDHAQAVIPNPDDLLRHEEIAGDKAIREMWLHEYAEIGKMFWPREKLEQYHLSRALFYAYLDLDGNWNGRGDMGWWGISHDEQDTYDTEFWDFINALPEDQLIYIVDCHI